MNRIRWGLVAILAVALVAAIITGTRYRKQALRHALAADSMEAVLDTTRQELWGIERRTIQAEIERDSLDRALKRRTVARGVVRVTQPPDTIVLQAPVETIPGDSVRFGHFEGRFARGSWGIGIQADVWLPRPPTLGTMDVSIVPEPWTLGIRWQCGEPNRGIRPATLLLQPPEGVRIVIDTAFLIPLACNDQAIRGLEWGFGQTAKKTATLVILGIAALKVAEWVGAIR